MVRPFRQRLYQHIGASSRKLDSNPASGLGGHFTHERPDYVFLAAARVGGILANQTYPADFIYTNLMIQSNVIHSAYLSNVKKLLFLGSSCIYPKLANQPIGESELLTQPLEPTNEAYAIAKIAELKGEKSTEGNTL
jgi:GDP-L-fucose synthase